MQSGNGPAADVRRTVLLRRQEPSSVPDGTASRLNLAPASTGTGRAIKPLP